MAFLDILAGRTQTTVPPTSTPAPTQPTTGITATVNPTAPTTAPAPTAPAPTATKPVVYDPWNPNPRNPPGTIYAQPGISPGNVEKIAAATPTYQRLTDGLSSWESRQDRLAALAAQNGQVYTRQAYPEQYQLDQMQRTMWHLGYREGMAPSGGTASSGSGSGTGGSGGSGSTGGGTGGGGAGGGQVPGGGGVPGGGPVPGGLMNFADSAASYYQQANGVGNQLTHVDTRTPEEQELASYWLDKMLDPDSPLAKRAIQTGKDVAASRGLMNSSLAGGNAYGEWVDRVQPYALDAAGTYQRTAAENMAARNVGHTLDSQQEAQRRASIRDYLLGTSTDYNRANLNVENREDTQVWQGGQNAADRAAQLAQTQMQLATQKALQQSSQGWQTGERLGTQAFSAEQQAQINAFNRGERVDTQFWNDAQRQAAESFQWGRDQLSAQLQQAGIDAQTYSVMMQAYTNFATGNANSLGQALTTIYSQTGMTPAQQAAAAQNAEALFNRINPTMPMPTAPTSGYTTPAPYQPYAPPSAPNSSGLAYGPSGAPLFSFGLT